MDPKLLTESGWKATALKFKIKDNGLQRALAAYEQTDDKEHDELIKKISSISQLAGNLKKAREVAAEGVALKYLTDLVAALELELREINKAKALAKKTEADAAKTEAITQKKSEAEAKKRDEEEAEEEEDEDDEDEEEEGEGVYAVRLTSAFQKLKGAKDVAFEFIVCDAKPHCGLMVAKRITPKHKQELTTVTGGSKRFLHLGTCQFEDGRFVFNMEKPVAGLARKLQDSLKYFTGKKLPIKVGTESAEADEGQPESGQPDAGSAAVQSTGGPFSIGGTVGRGGKNNPQDVQAVQAALNRRVKAGLPEDGKCGPGTIDAIMEFQKLLGQFKPDGSIQPGRGTARELASSAKLGPPPEPPKPIAPPKLAKATLANAPAVWHGTREILATNIEELKKGIRAHYGAEHPDVLTEIDENLKKLGGILGKLDTRLADALKKAHAAGDDAARNAELKNAKIILTDYIKYVKSESMIVHLDANPFGVDTNLKKVLMDSLTHMAQAIG